MGPVKSLTTAVAVLAAIICTASNAQEKPGNGPSQYGERKVHCLMILADSDFDIGPTVKFDARLIGFLFKEQVPRENAADPAYLLQSKDALTVVRIVESIQGMKIGKSDTLFCFYSGRGGFDAEKRLRLNLPDGTQLTQSVLLSVLKSKGARTTVLLTDCLTPGAALPLPDEELVLKREGEVPQAISRLLFSHSGVVELNAFSPGERGCYHQEPTKDRAESLGSLFVRELIREFTVGESAGEASIGWPVFMRRLGGQMERSRKMATKMAEGSKILTTEQSPYSASMPCKVITNSIGMKLVLIPAGEFMMGSGESAEDLARVFAAEGAKVEWFKVEKPQHQVRITKPFYLGQYEVTLGQFLLFYHDAKYKTEAERDGKGGWGYTGDKKKPFEQNAKYVAWDTGFRQTNEHPVVNVSWNDAVAFCEWLTRKEGKTYQLPTEAQWEYACRAGTTSRYYSGDDLETLTTAGNMADAAAKKSANLDSAIRGNDGYVFTAPVGSFRANAFGLYDMHGNAWEWCADWYDSDYYRNSPAADPTGSVSGSRRVLRGGGWGCPAVYCRSASRDNQEPEFRSDLLGFRVSQVADE